MNTVGTRQLTIFQSVVNILGIVFIAAFGIGLLNATARGSIIVGDGQTYHRAVGKLHRTLYQTFSE